jgi:hypothetical protein
VNVGAGIGMSVKTDCSVADSCEKSQSLYPRLLCNI